MAVHPLHRDEPDENLTLRSYMLGSILLTPNWPNARSS
jgi:hypothetical protein